MGVVRQALEKAQAQLGPEAFRTAMVDGRALTMEQALAHIVSLYVQTDTATRWMVANTRRLAVRE